MRRGEKIGRGKRSKITEEVVNSKVNVTRKDTREENREKFWNYGVWKAG